MNAWRAWTGATSSWRPGCRSDAGDGAAKHKARNRRRDRRSQEGPGAGRRRPSSCWAPSATRAGASTTSCGGRPGRQGDPGHSKFFLSCEDDLLRIFAGERLDGIMRTFGVQEGEAITHKGLNSAIATRPEARRAVTQLRDPQEPPEVRRDVVNDQRKAVFEQRAEFMAATDISDVVAEMRLDTIREDFVRRRFTCRPRPMPSSGTSRAWTSMSASILGLEAAAEGLGKAEDGIANEEIEERIVKAADARASPSATPRSATTCARWRRASSCR